MRHTRGFTLIEVLVALLIMATMAVMSWRGIDAIMRTRELSQASLERSARLQTVLAQWEQDLHAVQDSGGVPPLAFDGSTLRVTRTHAQGLQVVAWSLRNGQLYRWAGTPATTLSGLNESYQRSLQAWAQDTGQLRALEGLSGWQLYYYRVNAWSNAQSSGDVQAPGPAASGAGGSQPLPSGVRVLLQFAPGSGFGGPLTRQVLLEPGT
ncbi:PulJ/GspJ family protein [Paucibacter soli]|uniref:PulJ/GspJ family protein n=1 Tax=Paucibacter soli TaxID=3133433 RepID=UPI0030B54914